MKLTKLEPSFLKRDPKDGAEYWQEIDTFADADGIIFLCPKCFAEMGEAGCHSVVCWRPRVPPEIDPKPGRWEFVGTGYDDLTLVAGSSSILLTGPGCGAHFFIRNGEIEY